MSSLTKVFGMSLRLLVLASVGVGVVGTALMYALPVLLRGNGLGLDFGF